MDSDKIYDLNSKMVNVLREYDTKLKSRGKNNYRNKFIAFSKYLSFLKILIQLTIFMFLLTVFVTVVNDKKNRNRVLNNPVERKFSQYTFD